MATEYIYWEYFMIACIVLFVISIIIFIAKRSIRKTARVLYYIYVEDLSNFKVGDKISITDDNGNYYESLIIDIKKESKQIGLEDK